MTSGQNEQSVQRRAKLAQLRDKGNPYPNDFRRTHVCADAPGLFENLGNSAVQSEPVSVRLAGRLMSRRIMGKASFAHVRDESGNIQIYVQRDKLPEGVYNAEFKKFDIGDIVGVEGVLFRTKTGELTVDASQVRLLVKALHPLPEKFHGLTDIETRYRQRYVDLIVNEESREVFRKRAATIRALRQFLDQRGYLEIESPIMQPLPGGANARPFVTHHNALDRELFLRVAQELYIKRCLVGGFEKVYELNRNFRNEGIDTQHNPEFTMLEYNEAYVDYQDYMGLTEDMLQAVAESVIGTALVEYEGQQIDFSPPFRRLTMRDAVLEFNPTLSENQLQDPEVLHNHLESLGVQAERGFSANYLLVELFDHTVERHLIQPTYITGYPEEVSPLSRRSEQDAELTDRFELYAAGRELANGFSELNDAEDQAQRFEAQAAAKAQGDEEAMYFDDDYINALEYGLPPNAGGGLGVDRFVMLLTGCSSIRDVLLFPHMRPERNT